MDVGSLASIVFFGGLFAGFFSVVVLSNLINRNKHESIMKFSG